MKNNFFYKNKFSNIYKKSSKFSEVISQILYGEKFKILLKKKNWFKIKTSYDSYIGYIKKTHYTEKFNPTHKIINLKARIFKYPKNLVKYKSNNFLPFASKIKVLKKYKNFIMFDKNKWLHINDIKKDNYQERNFIKILKLFINCKYKWGGKTFNGIDCSGLLQIFFQFNNKFVPRDTKDQIKFFNKKKILNKDRLIFWKGHVAICINKNSLIHAYGPKKKVLIMNIKKTINEIRQNANLKVITK